MAARVQADLRGVHRALGASTPNVSPSIADAALFEVYDIRQDLGRRQLIAGQVPAAAGEFGVCVFEVPAGTWVRRIEGAFSSANPVFFGIFDIPGFTAQFGFPYPTGPLQFGIAGRVLSATSPNPQANLPPGLSGVALDLPPPRPDTDDFWIGFRTDAANQPLQASLMLEVV